MNTNKIKSIGFNLDENGFRGFCMILGLFLGFIRGIRGLAHYLG